MAFLKTGLREYLSILESERQFYDGMIDTSIKGSLTVMNRASGLMYLQSIPVKNDNGKTTYSRKSISRSPDLISALATNAFAKEALKIIDNNKKQLEDAYGSLTDLGFDTVISRLKTPYNKLPKSFYRKFLSEGVMERYREWMLEPFEQSGYKPEGKKFDTGRGLKVRSKSEIMFVEKFFQYSVPFRYEEVLRIDGYELVPDFTFPTRNGDKLYLEYCGMMDNKEYVERFLWKRRIYENAGIKEWDNMIYVFDSNNNLDMNKVDSIIKTMILPKL